MPKKPPPLVGKGSQSKQKQRNNTHKYHDLISAAVNWDTGTAVVTVSDDAFGLLLLENYLEKWRKKIYAKRKGEVMTGKLAGAYTTTLSKRNYEEFGGWSWAAMKTFTYYCMLIKENNGSHGMLLFIRKWIS